MNNTVMEVHLLNVQVPLNRDISRSVSRRSLHNEHRDKAEDEMATYHQMLDGFSIPYSAQADRTGTWFEHKSGISRPRTNAATG